MKKQRQKKLTLSKETLGGLDKLAQGGTGVQFSDPIVCGGGGGGRTSANYFYDHPVDCGGSL